jgi:hypothetical protein
MYKKNVVGRLEKTSKGDEFLSRYGIHTQKSEILSLNLLFPFLPISFLLSILASSLPSLPLATIIILTTTAIEFKLQLFGDYTSRSILNIIFCCCYILSFLSFSSSSFHPKKKLQEKSLPFVRQRRDYTQRETLPVTKFFMQHLPLSPLLSQSMSLSLDPYCKLFNFIATLKPFDCPLTRL